VDFFEELKRRTVIRVGIAYGVTAWVVMAAAARRRSKAHRINLSNS
jgi:hypothetical protein